MSLPEDLRGRLANARFVKTEEEKDGKGVVRKITWELKAGDGETLAKVKFDRIRGSWTVWVEGSLAEELKTRLGEKYRQRLQMAPAEVSADVRLAQLLGLLATDLHLEARGGKASRIELTTTEDWLFAAAATLLGEKEPSASVNVTLDGVKPEAKVYWSVEALNRAIKESRWVRELLERGLFRSVTVQTLYGLAEKPVETIDEVVTRLRWDLVLNTLVKMGEELKPLLCGKEKRCSAEELSRRFNELSGEMKKFVEEVGRLADLRGAWRKEKDKKRKEELHKQIRKVYNKAREYLAPALLLLELDAAKTKEEMEEALWRFALVFSATMAGDGHVDKYDIELASGEGGPALLWLAALYKAAEVQARLMQKAAEVAKEDREIEPAFTPRLRQIDAAYRVLVTDDGLVNLAVLTPAIGINPKAEEAVMAFRERGGALEVEVKNLRRTAKGAAADVIIGAGGLEARYWTYLGEKIMLQFRSTSPEEVEKAAHLLRLAGVKAEVGKMYDKQRERYVWYVEVTTDRLADKDVDAGLREKLAEAVRKAAEADLIDKETAERWAEKLREGVTVAEDMPKFTIRIGDRGGLDIKYQPRSGEQLDKYAETLRRLGLVEGVHFTVKEPRGDEKGRLTITVEGVVKLGELTKPQ